MATEIDSTRRVVSAEDKLALAIIAKLAIGCDLSAASIHGDPTVLHDLVYDIADVIVETLPLLDFVEIERLCHTEQES